jgi:hypothetical protein
MVDSELETIVERRPTGECEVETDTLDIAAILKSPVTAVVGIGLLGFFLLG